MLLATEFRASNNSASNMEENVLCYLNHYVRQNKSYLIWKRDSNAEGKQSSIHLRQVEQDGITFRDEWRSVTLLVANYTTERRVIEGPWMIFRLV